METSLNRNEKIIAGTAFVAIAVFFAMFLKVSGNSGSTVNQIDTQLNINYKMGKLDSTYSEYSLEGREIELTYEGVPNKDKKELAKTEKDKLEQKKKELLAKQKSENKKKEDLKKKQTEQAKAIKQSQTETNVAESEVSEAKDYSDYDSVDHGNGYVISIGAQNSPAANNNVEKENEAKKNTKTFADWQKQIFATPTTEVLAQFIAAFKKGDVSEAEYQAMAQDLINQNDNKFKALGLLALKSSPSFLSLSQLVHLDPAKVVSFQGYIEQSLRAYLLPQNLKFLVQGLSTQDKKLVIKSLNLLNTSLAKLSQGDASGIIDPRNVRDDQVTSLSMNTYRSLIPVLTTIIASQDQAVVGLAQQVTAIIQSSNNVAVN